MTVTIHAWFDREGPEILRSADDVLAFVGKVRAESVACDAPLFTSWGVAGDVDSPEFGVGIHGDIGVVTYSGRAWGGLNFSAGSDTSDELLSYDYQGHERPVPASAQIPLAALLTAAQQFLASGGDRPTSVGWRNYD